MIELTRLDGSQFVLNAERIETVEARPDTVITLIDGKHFVVQQSVAEVTARVIAYHQSIHPHCIRWSSQPELSVHG